LIHGHFRRYHRDELAQKVLAAGGEVAICRYFDFAGIVPWLFLNKFLGSTTFNPRLVGMHDKFVVPISRAVERMTAPPVGKNLVLVASKLRPTR
jgi:hypothetical protein